jgi:hypothetical protein
VDVNVFAPAPRVVVDFSACRLGSTGSVRCWGGNISGQLGTGDSANVLGGSESLPVVLDLASDTVDVRMGFQHLCALSNVGDVRCLGTGFNGANGVGTGEDVGDDPNETPPTPIDLPAPARLIGSAGYANCAWLDNRQLWCWGDNDEGQLGQGDTLSIGDNEPVSTGSPVPIFGPTN